MSGNPEFSLLYIKNLQQTLKGPKGKKGIESDVSTAAIMINTFFAKDLKKVINLHSSLKKVNIFKKKSQKISTYPIKLDICINLEKQKSCKKNSLPKM